MVRGREADESKDSAIKLPFALGEYLCTWDIPDIHGTTTQLPGMLTLEAGKYPHGFVYGEVPIEWKNGAASFPQTHLFDSLTGRLASGAYVSLMNGTVSYLSFIDNGQGNANGALCVLSLHPFDDSAHQKYTSVEFQVEELDVITNTAPLSSEFPTRGEDREYSVKFNRDARWNWTADGLTLGIHYNASMRSLDPYEFHVRTGPVVTLRSETPLAIVEWWTLWIQPFQRLVSVITGGSRKVTFLLAYHGEETPRTVKDQVFGLGIDQDPFTSRTPERKDRPGSAVKLSDDAVSLLDLLVRWNKEEAARHPIIETYGSLATVQSNEHPRSRFLLLIQALEGLHGHETEAERVKQRKAYAQKRAEFLALHPIASLAKKDAEFLEKNLFREPRHGLDEALAAVFKGLPVDVVPELAGGELVASVRELEGGKELRVEVALAKARHLLSHGSRRFDASALNQVVQVLERVVRSEVLRIVGAPNEVRERALKRTGS